MSWINPEPIAPAAPILVHGDVQDGYLQQRGAEDRINIELNTSTEPKSGAEPLLPKKDPGSTFTSVRVRQDRIDIREFERGAEDSINVELVTSAEPKSGAEPLLPKRDPGSATASVHARQDRIDILEFECERQAGRAATPGPHAPDPADNPQPAVTL